MKILKPLKRMYIQLLGGAVAAISLMIAGDAIGSGVNGVCNYYAGVTQCHAATSTNWTVAGQPPFGPARYSKSSPAAFIWTCYAGWPATYSYCNSTGSYCIVKYKNTSSWQGNYAKSYSTVKTWTSTFICVGDKCSTDHGG